MDNLTITRDTENPDLYHLTIDRRTLAVLQAAGKAYKCRLEASRRHYQNHKESLKEKRRLAKLAANPPSPPPPQPEKNPTLSILDKVTNYPC